MTPRVSSVLCFTFLSAAAFPATAQITTRVSLATGGTQGNLDSFSPALSTNGRYAAFYSEASNLVPGDLNGAEDVFWRDRRTGITVRVSVDSFGGEADGDSYSPAISADGRYVAYSSAATNLVPGDTNGFEDIFVFDRLSATTSRVSVDSAGLQSDGRSYYPSLSADGRFVCFQSFGTTLVVGDVDGVSDIFLHDRVSGITTLVSVGPGGVQADADCEYASISADGTRLVFVSRTTNFAAGDTNGSPDIFLRDLSNGSTTCVSVAPSGFPGTAGCAYASISGDGRSVAFSSWSANLVPGDTNGWTDVFVRNLVTATTARVSVSTSGVQAIGGISNVNLTAALSYDGRFVAFKSYADNLVANDTNGVQDIFLRDRRLGTTTRVNVGPNLAQADQSSSQPMISSDGKHIGFYSFATNLVPGDTNGEADVFVRTL